MNSCNVVALLVTTLHEFEDISTASARRAAARDCYVQISTVK